MYIYIYVHMYVQYYVIVHDDCAYLCIFTVICGDRTRDDRVYI